MFLRAVKSILRSYYMLGYIDNFKWGQNTILKVYISLLGCVGT